MVSIQEAKSQVRSARETLSKRRKEAKEEEAKISKRKTELTAIRQSLPERKSQMALRKTLGGLSGRMQRRKIKGAETKISKQKGKLTQAQKDIEKFEKELTKYEEEQIKPVETKIRKTEEYNRAVETIKKAADQGMVWAYAFYGEGLVKKLAQEYQKKQKLRKESLKKREISEGSFIDPGTGYGYSIAPEFAKEEGLVRLQDFVPRKKEIEFKNIADIAREKSYSQQMSIAPSLSQKKESITKRLLLGDIGKGLVGIGTGIGGSTLPAGGIATTIGRDKEEVLKKIRPAVTFSEIKEKAREITAEDIPSPIVRTRFSPLERKKQAFAVRTISEGIPETPADILLYGGTGAVGAAATPAIQTGLGLGFGAIGTAGALDKTKTTEERVFSGLVAVGGLLGARAGIKARSRAKVTNLLEKEPELFVGLKKTKGDTTKLAILSRRKDGRFTSETKTVLDLRRTGKDSFQVERGKGVLNIGRESRFFSDVKPIDELKFTFSGEGTQVSGRQIRNIPEGRIVTNIREGKPSFTELELLTLEKTPRFSRSFGLGLDKRVTQRQLEARAEGFNLLGDTGGEFTKVLSFPVSRARVKVSETRNILDIGSGKLRREIKFGASRIEVRPSDLRSAGIIRDITKREGRSSVLNIGRTTQVSEFPSKSIGSSVALQAERQAFTLTSPKRTTTSLLFAGKKSEQLPNLLTGTTQAPETKFKTEIKTTTEQKPISLSEPEAAPKEKELSFNLFNKKEEVSVSLKSPKFKLDTLKDSDNRLKQSFDITTTQAKSQRFSFKNLFSTLSKSTSKLKSQEVSNRFKETLDIKPKNIKPKNIKPKTKTTTTAKDLFKVFAREKGEDVLISTEKTKKAAEEKLFGELGRELIASGFIQRRGKRISPSKLSEGFRFSKVEPLRVVERKERRIKKKGKSREAEQIQFFRRRKNDFF